MKYKINMPKYMNRDIKNCLICFPETKHEDNVRHKLNGSFYTDIQQNKITVPLNYRVFFLVIEQGKRVCTFINKQPPTSPTLCCFYKSCLEHCLWPGFGDKTVGVSDHRKNHGRGGVDSIFYFSPNFFHLICILNSNCTCSVDRIHFQHFFYEN